jgi:hypothetical protein
MKIQFARIFELENNQVLIMKDEDSEETYQVNQMSDFGDFKTSLALCFNSEGIRDACFDSYTSENAQSFVDYINNMIKES